MARAFVGIPQLSRWGRLVTVSAFLVVAGVGVLAVWGLLSQKTRVVSYAVHGELNGVTLDIGEGDAEIVGGGSRSSVAVQRTDEYAFDHDAHTTRAITGGVLRLRSDCPSTVLHTCSARYRLTVPDNLPVRVMTAGGSVLLNGFQGTARITTTSGDVTVRAYCGFLLQVRTRSGNVDAQARCPPERLALRSTSGDVRATVPPGRYRVVADSNSGADTVRSLTESEDAPFAIQALSTSGDVVVEGRR